MMKDVKRELACDKNRAAASKNLRIKLKVLTHFVNEGIPWKREMDGSYERDSDTGSRIIDFFPKSAFQFSRWTLDSENERGLHQCPWVRNELQKNFGFFTSHGQDSLSKKNRSNEYEQAQRLFTAIKKTAKTQWQKEHQEDLVSQLRHEIVRWKAAAEAQATFVSQALSQKADLEKQVVLLNRALAEVKHVSLAQLEEKDSLIARLKQEVREIRGFKKIDGSKK